MKAIKIIGVLMVIMGGVAMALRTLPAQTIQGIGPNAIVIEDDDS